MGNLIRIACVGTVEHGYFEEAGTMGRNSGSTSSGPLRGPPSPAGKAFGLLAICSLGVTVTAVLMLFNRKVREI